MTRGGIAAVETPREVGPSIQQTAVNAFDGSIFELVMPAPRPVLLVNGDIDSRAIYRMALAQAGIEVITVGDSSSGLRVARITQPKVIVLDIATRQDGFDSASRMRTDAALHDTTMIALADHEISPHQRAMIEADFDRVLLKPIEPSAMLAAVRQGLAWRPNDGSLSSD